LRISPAISGCELRRAARRGVTLLEVLVAIAVIAVLLGITLPALRGARTAAGQVESVSNARTVASAMLAYADAFGRWPFAYANQSAPGAPRPDGVRPGTIAFPTIPPGSFIGTGDHWQHATLWPGLVALVAPWEEHLHAWLSPGRYDDTIEEQTKDGQFIGAEVSYLYSTSFIATPALWSGSATADQSLVAPTRPEDVASPANKVLVWDGDLAYRPERSQRFEGHWLAPTPMAFVDGHAAVHHPLDAAPGVANPLNNNSSVRLHNTPGGVLGRDY